MSNHPAPRVMPPGDVLLVERAEQLPSPSANIDGGGDVTLGYVEQQQGYRSDVRDLLASFLAHTRSEERMSEDLRRMLGVDRGPSRGRAF
jgi:hypothetical protein